MSGMKKKDTNEKLSDLFHGKLLPGEAEKINSELNGINGADDEIESIGNVNQLIDKIPVEEPSSSMDARFYEMMADESKEMYSAGRSSDKGIWSHSSPMYAGIRIAAGIALFLLGWFMSYWFRQNSISNGEATKLAIEMKDLRETLFLTMLNQSSSLDRIKAVSMVSELEHADDRIIGSLLGALNYDNNNNVRLLSLEALLKYSGNPEVRDGLIASIKNQSSPLIQLRLAEVMVALREKKAVPEFQRILTNTGMNYMVRNKINEAVTLLL